MPMIDDSIPEHKTRGRRRRQNFDSEQESLQGGVAGPGWTQSGVHEGHATGGINDEGKEGIKAPHKPEHGIRPSTLAVHRLPAFASRGTGEMGSNVEGAGPAGTTKNHQVLVTQIRRGH